jgi:hypothetical protein
MHGVDLGCASRRQQGVHIQVAVDGWRGSDADRSVCGRHVRRIGVGV